MKYNLTFWQRLHLIPLKIYWLLTISPIKKTWHEVKKGMEKHECKFTKHFTERGTRFAQCEHEGCYTVTDLDFDNWAAEHNKFIADCKAKIELLKK